MKRLLFLGLTAIIAVAMSATTVTYTADDQTIFPNPERGFITMLTGHLTNSSPYAVKGQESALTNHANNDKGSIILVHYYLDSYKTNGTLPSKILNAFDEDMAVLRNKGMKAIIRFSYVDHDENETAVDASFSIVKQHINQYKSHWQANADVIFCFQAGIVGAWGEWYYTSHYGNKVDYMNDARREVVDSLLSAVPADRCIQLRTPKFKTTYLNSTQPLTAAEAWQNTPKARLGQHNDAFLYDYDNMGTYSDTATQKPWLAQETLYVPLGGETDITELSKTKKWATYEKTTAEMSRLHWTFIQSGYAETTTNYWRGNGTFDELNRKMGYRYQLVNGTYSNQVAAGGKLSVNMKIKNVGYAPLYNERHAYIVLKNGNKTYSLQLASDPRKWLPNGVETTINEQLTVPSTVPAGTYQLYLNMPDAYASLASDPRYSVRFANTNVWESATGLNSLNATVTVTSEGGVTPPEPQTGDSILLPATLNKANVTAYCDEMTWYASDYFDFGPGDAPNTERWAEWKVALRYPGEYTVSEVGYYPNGHAYSLRLLNGDAEAAAYTTQACYATGTQTITQEDAWDLTNVPAGVYMLRVQNVMEWGQPKLQSLTLQYNGQLPTEKMTVAEENTAAGQGYDLLGRPVDDTYRGVVVRRGKKTVRGR